MLSGRLALLSEASVHRVAHGAAGAKGMRVTWAEPAALLDGPAHARAPASGSAGSANIEEMPPPPSRPASNADAPGSGSAVQSFYEKKRRQSSNADAPASGSASVTQGQTSSSTSDSRWKKQSSSSEADAGRSWGGNAWSRSAWDYNK
jgi:hypothetical protein